MERIGEYEVRRLIGEGGMGKVYEAEERLSGRRVALKVMRAELARSEDARRLFRSEMQILARLEHPHIVRSLTSFEADGQLVLALEYLRGRTLRDALIARGRLVWQEVVEIAAQICEALVAAHGCEPSVVHRDLKPENVMLVPPTASDTGPGADGTNLSGTEEVKVMDFGIAKVLEAARATNTQSVGTLEYMSPEQIDARPIDGRSDLYALGLVMYEMLAGHVPFRSASPRELLNLQCTADVPDLPEDARSGLPGGVEELIFDLLEKSPEDRPEDARAVLDRLTALRPNRRAPRRRAERDTGSVAADGTRKTQPADAARSGTRTRPPGRLDTVALLEQGAAPREVPRATR
jgi:serine/threonine protein kinase